ncbi:hypothetical protein L1049_028130 [Liquidambar formosana]|uniref:Serine-threonine/tyrosine-protein kinase catalytic domain-containing protein n=1 Tax=Liquidambar formosana TaxID=63359 RepID=A0AAP0WW46_LIQFO
MYPEYVVHGHLTENADIYSFGVLVLEIMTGQRCNDGLGAKSGQNFLAKIWSHYKAKKIGKIIDRSFYKDAMEDDKLHVVHVALLCTQATPCFRPTMAKVVELLRSCKDKIDVFPTEPPFLDVPVSEILEEGEGSHLPSPPSFSGSSGNLFYG